MAATTVTPVPVVPDPVAPTGSDEQPINVEAFDDILDTGDAEEPTSPSAAPAVDGAVPVVPPTEPQAPSVPPVVVAPPSPEPTPVVQPVAQAPQPVAATPPAPPVQQPAQPLQQPVPSFVAPQQPVQQPQAPMAPMPSEEEQRAAILQRRNALIEDITGRYQISEEDKAALAVEPEKVLPKIAARLYVDVYEAVLQASLGQLPMLINGYNQVQRVVQQHEQAFYQKWPALQKPEYEPTIRQIAATYRQMNPTAAAEDVMNAVGVMAMVHLGVQQQAPAAVPSTAPPSNTPSPVPASAPRPFTPAGVGGSANPSPAASPTPFDDLLAPDSDE